MLPVGHRGKRRIPAVLQRRTKRRVRECHRAVWMNVPSESKRVEVGECNLGRKDDRCFLGRSVLFWNLPRQEQRLSLNLYDVVGPRVVVAMEHPVGCENPIPENTLVVRVETNRAVISIYPACVTWTDCPYIWREIRRPCPTHVWIL